MKIGDKIPEMLGVDANGKEVKASDYAGKRLAIYFYPKDNTPGCTAEACSLRDGTVTDIIAKVDTKNSASQILEIINKKA